MLPHLSAAQLTYIPVSPTVKQFSSCLQSVVGPQFLGQWDMLGKKSLPSFCFLVPNNHMSKTHKDNLKSFPSPNRKNEIQNKKGTFDSSENCD